MLIVTWLLIVLRYPVARPFRGRYATLHDTLLCHVRHLGVIHRQRTNASAIAYVTEGPRARRYQQLLRRSQQLCYGILLPHVVSDGHAHKRL